MYKETVALDIKQTEGGEEDKIEGRDPTDDKDTDLDSKEREDAPSVEEDSMNETSPAGRDTENVEQEWQDEVVGDTSAIGLARTCNLSQTLAVFLKLISHTLSYLYNKLLCYSFSLSAPFSFL